MKVPSSEKPLKITRTIKIFILEAGMLGGIVLAFYTVPANTPLRTLIIASVAGFVLGNVLMIRSLRSTSNVAATERGFWSRILLAGAILPAAWLLVAVMRRL
jgi:hypothetical protein